MAVEKNEASYGRLLASAPRRGGVASARAGSVSLGIHAAVVVALVWATMAAGSTPEAEEEVTVVELVEEVAPPPPPPPPDTPPPQAQVEVPKGFQTLLVPTFVPPELPPPSDDFAGLTEADFSGEGVEGGRADGTPDTVAVADADQPSFTPYTVAPTLRNRDEVGRALMREYPPLLRDAGIGGTVVVWLYIDVDGAARNAKVNTTSGHEALDEAALRVGRLMRFTPALNRDLKTPVWVALPITFQVR